MTVCGPKVIFAFKDNHTTLTKTETKVTTDIKR